MSAKIIQVIEVINQDIYESGQFVEFPPLTYKTDGYCEIVEIFGYQIWSSEDQEDRGYDEKMDTYEPIGLYLRRMVNQFVEIVSKIEVVEE